MLGREASRPAGEANIESSSSVLSQGNSFLLCDQDWHRQLPPSALVFLACCWFYCVIFLPMGPIPDFFQKYLATSFSFPFWSPLCSGAAQGVMHCCWVTFADTLLTGTESHNDFLRWNFPLICVCLCLWMCCFLFFLGFRVMSQLYKLHHHHPDINSSYSRSGQPCCSCLRAGAEQFLMVSSQILDAQSRPIMSGNQGLSLQTATKYCGGSTQII